MALSEIMPFVYISCSRWTVALIAEPDYYRPRTKEGNVFTLFVRLHPGWVPRSLVPCPFWGANPVLDGGFPGQDRTGYLPYWDWGSRQPGQEWGTTMARTGLGYPPPPPGTGYAAGGMPLAVSRRTFLCSFVISSYCQMQKCRRNHRTHNCAITTWGSSWSSV